MSGVCGRRRIRQRTPERGQSRLCVVRAAALLPAPSGCTLEHCVATSLFSHATVPTSDLHADTAPCPDTGIALEKDMAIELRDDAANGFNEDGSSWCAKVALITLLESPFRFGPRSNRPLFQVATQWRRQRREGLSLPLDGNGRSRP